LNKQYNPVMHPASYYTQALSVSSQGHNPSAVDEDDKITLRLSSVRSIENRLTEHEDQTRALCDSPSLNEINLDGLSAGDQILIETAHSLYSFTITDPHIPSGKLIGGILGNRPVNAALVPSYSGNRRLRFVRRKLRTSSKFTFLLEHGNCLRRLTTSVVTKLIHRKKGGTRVLPAGMREVKIEHLSGDKLDV
jgi:hypothetical protein